MPVTDGSPVVRPTARSRGVAMCLRGERPACGPATLPWLGRASCLRSPPAPGQCHLLAPLLQSLLGKMVLYRSLDAWPGMSRSSGLTKFEGIFWQRGTRMSSRDSFKLLSPQPFPGRAGPWLCGPSWGQRVGLDGGGQERA